MLNVLHNRRQPWQYHTTSKQDNEAEKIEAAVDEQKLADFEQIQAEIRQFRCQKYDPSHCTQRLTPKTGSGQQRKPQTGQQHLHTSCSPPLHTQKLTHFTIQKLPFFSIILEVRHTTVGLLQNENKLILVLSSPSVEIRSKEWYAKVGFRVPERR